MGRLSSLALSPGSANGHTCTFNKLFIPCLQDRSNDIERLSSERDYYFKLLDDHNKEFDTIKAQKETLTVQLEEREKALTALQVRF